MSSNWADETALAGLSARYAFAIDERDGDAFADVFTAGGRLEVRRGADDAIPSSVVEGRRELTQVPRELADRYRATRHVVSPGCYVLTDAEATGCAYCTALHLGGGAGGGWDAIRFVRYDDTYVCHDGRWLIAERVAYVEWTQRVAVELGLI